MTIWNAPEPVPDHPQMACTRRATLPRRDPISRATPEWGEFPAFETRFGLHCAKALVGYFGARDRMNYTAIGDAITAQLNFDRDLPHRSETSPRKGRYDEGD
jgi:adenylate cyclase